MQGLQPNFKLVGDFLENCFVWYFSTAHIADGYSTAGRSPDDVVPEVARMSDPGYPPSRRFRFVPPDCERPDKIGLFRFSRLPVDGIVFRTFPRRSEMEPGD